MKITILGNLRIIRFWAWRIKLAPLLMAGLLAGKENQPYVLFTMASCFLLKRLQQVTTNFHNVGQFQVIEY